MTGKDFIPPLPFPVREGKLIWVRNGLKLSDKHLDSNSPLCLCFIQVSKVWVTKFGLLLERKNTATEAQFCPPGYAKHHNLTLHTRITHDRTSVKWCSCIQTIRIWQLTELFLVLEREPLPTIFSMLHPLDEIAPVVCKPGGNACILSLSAPLCLNQMSYLIPPCVVSRSFWGVTRAVCLGCHHDHSVQLLSALAGRFLWHGPGNTLCLGATQGHMWCKRSLSHTRKCTNTNTAVCTLLLLPFKERSSVLRCPVDPVGTPLRLMASGFLTSHLRNMSNLDSPCGVGVHGLGSGTGPRFVMHCFFFLIYYERISFVDMCFWPFWSNKGNVTIFWMCLHLQWKS